MIPLLSILPSGSPHMRSGFFFFRVLFQNFFLMINFSPIPNRTVAPYAFRYGRLFRFPALDVPSPECSDFFSPRRRNVFLPGFFKRCGDIEEIVPESGSSLFFLVHHAFGGCKTRPWEMLFFFFFSQILRSMALDTLCLPVRTPEGGPLVAAASPAARPFFPPLPGFFYLFFSGVFHSPKVAFFKGLCPI